MGWSKLHFKLLDYLPAGGGKQTPGISTDFLAQRSTCQDNCLQMLSLRISHLSNQICTGDSSLDFIKSGTTNGFIDWLRLEPELLRHHSRSNPAPRTSRTGSAFPKLTFKPWIRNYALVCNSEDAFFRPSRQHQSSDQFAGAGLMCLSNFKGYRLLRIYNYERGEEF